MPSATASVNGTLIAKSADTVVVEGNQYFPPAALQDETLFEKSDTTTVCHWKGTASYYNLKLPNGSVLKDAVWYYPDPKPAAAEIKDYFAFYKNKVDVKLD